MACHHAPGWLAGREAGGGGALGAGGHLVPCARSAAALVRDCGVGAALVHGCKRTVVYRVPLGCSAHRGWWWRPTGCRSAQSAPRPWGLRCPGTGACHLHSIDGPPRPGCRRPPCRPRVWVRGATHTALVPRAARASVRRGTRAPCFLRRAASRRSLRDSLFRVLAALSCAVRQSAGSAVRSAADWNVQGYQYM